MSITMPAETPHVTHPSIVAPRFTGDRRAYLRLMLRGALFQGLTLGIYRFWLFTDMRRFLWSRTEANGDTLEYTGTATELLLGFLMAIAILVPIYALLFVATYADAGLIRRASGLAGFVALAWFGQYAAFRARRYRLSRTVFRGIRFHQTGSPTGYALRAVAWWIAIALTFGLAYPFAQASLERYKLRHTFYGDLGAGFAGTGWALLRRTLLLWLIVVGPLFGTVIYAAAVMDWPALTAALAVGDINQIIAAIRANHPIAVAIGIVAVASRWSTTFAVLFYPAFQAMMLRWWLSGLRLGEATVASKFRTRSVYGAYLRYSLYAFLLLVAFIAVVVIGAMTVNLKPASMMHNVTLIGGSVVAYMTLLLLLSAIYQVVVKYRLWQIAVDSMAISRFAVLETAKAGGAAASAVGEGLADALGSGGF